MTAGTKRAQIGEVQRRAAGRAGNDVVNVARRAAAGLAPLAIPPKGLRSGAVPLRRAIEGVTGHKKARRPFGAGRNDWNYLSAYLSLRSQVNW